MGNRRRVVLWATSALVFGAILAAVLFFLLHRKSVALTGAVIARDADTRKALPIADVEVTVADGLAEAPSKSDSSGLFALRLRKDVRRGRAVTLQFRHPDYRPLDLNEFAGDKLYIAHMTPLSKKVEDDPGRPTTAVGNVRVRYSIKAIRALNIGSAVKAFQVENTGNVPCKGQPPCSPDGKWKAAIGSASLDAGTGNEFLNARASCIAGPCPFTKIEADGFSQGGQRISASARNWSDTTTFLLEAEVVHSMVSPIDYQSYPVIFGRALNFTLPATAEGVSIEADVGGETIIFPLGPALFLSWANCNARVNPDQTKVYRCELKPEYRFQ